MNNTWLITSELACLLQVYCQYTDYLLIYCQLCIVTNDGTFCLGEPEDYVFCDHCKKRVAKKTFYEHRNLPLSDTIKCDSLELAVETEYTSGSISPEELAKEIVHNEKDYDHSYSDQEESSLLFDDEDQIFFSDCDEPEVETFCTSGCDNTKVTMNCKNLCYAGVVKIKSNQIFYFDSKHPGAPEYSLTTCLGLVIF